MSHIEPESIAAALEASNELLHMTDPALRGGDDVTQGNEAVYDCQSQLFTSRCTMDQRSGGE